MECALCHYLGTEYLEVAFTFLEKFVDPCVKERNQGISRLHVLRINEVIP